MSNEAKNTNSLQAQIVAQWITSLAISVVCCAILFIVFAGYIVELHDTTNLLSVKLEVLQERHNQLNSELTLLKRPPVLQINGATALKTMGQPEVVLERQPQTPPPVGVAVEPSSPAVSGAEPVAKEAAAPKPEEDLMPVMNGAAPQEQVLKVIRGADGAGDAKSPAPKDKREK
ncbi:MAG: hypothetical protein AB7E52_04475 [Bdellovibrionales bacterium]